MGLQAVFLEIFKFLVSPVQGNGSQTLSLHKHLP